MKMNRFSVQMLFESMIAQMNWNFQKLVCSATDPQWWWVVIEGVGDDGTSGNGGGGGTVTAVAEKAVAEEAIAAVVFLPLL